MSETRAGLLGMLLSVAVGVVSGVLGAVFYMRWQVQPPQRFVVLDMRRLIEPVLTDTSLDDLARQTRTAEIGQRAHRTIEQQAATGAIVLDASAVLRAPQDLYVKP